MNIVNRRYITKSDTQNFTSYKLPYSIAFKTSSFCSKTVEYNIKIPFVNAETNERYRLFIVQTSNRVDRVSFAVDVVMVSTL